MNYDSKQTANLCRHKNKIATNQKDTNSSKNNSSAFQELHEDLTCVGSAEPKASRVEPEIFHRGHSYYTI